MLTETNTAAEMTDARAFTAAVRGQGWRVMRRFPPAAAFRRGDAETLVHEDPPVEALYAAIGAEWAAALDGCELVSERDEWGAWTNGVVMV